MTDKTFRLCYIDEPWAFFTTQPLDEQWGDDWNDVPYEHNAGHPYTWHQGRNGEPSWEIVQVAFDGWLETPGAGVINSRYSVEDINQRAVPWLRTERYVGPEVPHIEIWAGTSLDEFIELVQRGGGSVYQAVPKR